MRVQYTIEVDWPVRIERRNDPEIEEYIRNALMYYNGHCGYDYFDFREEPVVENIKILESK